MLSSAVEEYKLNLIKKNENLITLCDGELFKEIERSVFEDKELNLSFSDKENMVYEIYNSLRRFDVIQKYLDDPEISEIMLNSYDSIYIEKHGEIIKTSSKFIDKEKMLTIINRILGQVGKKVNKTTSIVDARLLDGSRINVILDPVSLRGPTVTIRKFVLKNVEMKDLVELGTVESDVCKLLDYFVKNRFNIFICGGTSSGKTTLLNAMSSLIPKHERIITIEDSAELSISNHDNCISLETKDVTKNAIDMSK
ncbi:MAG: ATPase, T2SS/T4P/T4SS family, partial [Acidaminobacteraceae bacterium]